MTAVTLVDLLKTATVGCHGKAPECAQRELGRSRETVRNWISRFTDNALVTELIGTRTLFTFDAHVDPMRVVWRSTPFARAVEALGLAIAAVVRLLGPLTPVTTPWSVVNVVTRGHLLSADLGP
jgi:hypothetical protein